MERAVAGRVITKSTPPRTSAFKIMLCRASLLRNRSKLWRKIEFMQPYSTPFHHFNLDNISRHISSSPVSSSSSDSSSSSKPPISILQNIDLLEQIPLEDCRNFCFIAHVDHGKSSLASRVLELCGNLGVEQQLEGLRYANKLPLSLTEQNLGKEERIPDEQQKQDISLIKITDNSTGKEQIELLDTLSVEQERGITVKASAASMLYTHSSAKGPLGILLLNCVDTPGHVDFSTEVSRTLSCVQGAVLLFDAAQGVQAQSFSVFDASKSMDNVKAILPVLTKVDLPAARPLEVALTTADLFEFDPDQVLLTSARSRIGISDVLEHVCNEVPPPMSLPDDDGKTLRAKVVDSWFEPLRGVVCLVQILSGKLEEGNRVMIVEPSSNGQNHRYNVKEHYSVQDVGLVIPTRVRTNILYRGQMGYVIVGLRDPREAKPGTILVAQDEVNKVVDMFLPALEEKSNSSVLYASVHPSEGEGFEELSNAIDRLALNDVGLDVQRTAGASNSSDGGPFLGPGLKVGFQGLLHVEVFQQRLRDEFDMEAIITPPKVPYKITYISSKGIRKLPDDMPKVQVIEDLSKWPDSGFRYKVEEPIVDVRILAPIDYAGNVMDLLKRKRSTSMETKTIDERTWLFTARVPWAEVVTSFHDELKNATAGYASFDSTDSDPPYEEANVCKVDIALNGEVVDPLAFVAHTDHAQHQGRIVCKKLQEVLPRQQFVTVIQAKTGTKVIASERIRAYRKDVLTTGGSKSVGGGDITRKKKLLEKQKKGKKRQQQSGKVRLTQSAFNSVITR